MTPGDEKDLTDKVNDIRDRVTRVEAKTETFQETIKSQQVLLQRIIWFLMALVSGLVGKETLSSMGKLNSTPMEYTQLALTGWVFGGLGFHLLFRALQDKRLGVMTMVAGILMLITAFLRVEVGFATITTKSNIIFSVPFAAAGILTLITAIRLKVR